jgi:hypothetical protein
VVLRLSDRPARIVRTARLAMRAGAGTGGRASWRRTCGRAIGTAFVRIASDRPESAAHRSGPRSESARRTASAVVLAAPPEVAERSTSGARRRRTSS